MRLHTVLVVREDGWALYGFDREHERGVFQRLLGASGVGPRLALALLSSLGGARVVQALRGGDLAALCTVSGVGRNHDHGTSSAHVQTEPMVLKRTINLARG